MRTLSGLLLSVVLLLGALDFPPLTGRVVDEAHLLSETTRKRMEETLAELEKRRGVQMAVVTLPSLQGLEIADYGYRLGRHWGIGKKGRDDGLLLIVAPRERKVRIEVGYGLEGTITDYAAHRIIGEKILPRFRAGDMAGGIEAGVTELLKLLQTDAKTNLPQKAVSNRSSPDFSDAYTLLALALFLTLFRMAGSLYGYAAVFGLLSGLFAWNASKSVWIGAAAALPAFALYVTIRKKVAESFTTAFPDASGRIASGGGGFLGGGRFGGFSGGGGSFGGGGASGSW